MTVDLADGKVNGGKARGMESKLTTMRSKDLISDMP